MIAADVMNHSGSVYWKFHLSSLHGLCQTWTNMYLYLDLECAFVVYLIIAQNFEFDISTVRVAINF